MFLTFTFKWRKCFTAFHFHFILSDNDCVLSLACNHKIATIDACNYVSPRFLCRPMAFFRLAGAVGCQSALHKENSEFTAPTLGRHISTFRGYQILFFYPKHLYKSLHQSFFLFIHNLSTFRKWCYTPLQHDFPLDPMISSFWKLPFWNICHVTSRKLQLPQCIMGDDLHIWSDLVQNRGNVTHALSEPRG